jgi:hypothetical protein
VASRVGAFAGYVATLGFAGLLGYSPGQGFVAEVERISPVMNADTGTFKVTLQLQDPTGVLRPGMFGRFAIVYDESTRGTTSASRRADGHGQWQRRLPC